MRFFRTLRFRLAATFLLLLIAVLTIMSVLVTRNLNEILENQSATQLSGQLGALKGWFQFRRANRTATLGRGRHE